MTGKTSRLTGYLLILVVCLVPACGFHIELPNSGEVSDAETGEPLRNVVVVKDIRAYCTGIGAGGDHKTIGLVEGLTDEKGHYTLSAGIYFYIIEPLFCYHDQNSLIFFKPGYFEKSELTSGLKTHESLFRMTHFLNYLPYIKRNMYFPSDFEEKSKLYHSEVEKLKFKDLEALDECGVFLRLRNRKLIRIYSRVMRDMNYRGPDSMIYYAYDDDAKEWINLDSRGKILDLKTNLPKWDFMDSDMTGGYPIYADINSIFFPVEKHPMSAASKYGESEITYLVPHLGNISGLAGTSDNFFTIENNGSYLCRYGRFGFGRTGYRNVPALLKCFKADTLTASNDKDALEYSTFTYLVQTLNHGIFVVTRTPKFWHIYNLVDGYDKQSRETRLIVKELYSFPLEKEITAFTATGNDFFVAFREDGIRKYNIINGQATEDASFNLNSRLPGNPRYKSLLIGWAVNLPAIYATAGDERIYRFSLKGIPDYILKKSAGD